jgi:hypothetical protein
MSRPLTKTNDRLIERRENRLPTEKVWDRSKL